jgi:hypothetical protein
MKRAVSKRQGTTRTMSISVDATTETVLRSFAERHFEGNVSALVSALAKELRRKEAMAWLLARSGVPRLSSEETAALLAEIDGRPSARRVA